MLLFKAVFACLFCICSCNPHAKKLYDDLLHNYNRLIRSVGLLVESESLVRCEFLAVCLTLSKLVLHHYELKNVNYVVLRGALVEVSGIQISLYWIGLKKLVQKHVQNNLVCALSPELPEIPLRPILGKKKAKYSIVSSIPKCTLISYLGIYSN